MHRHAKQRDSLLFDFQPERLARRLVLFVSPLIVATAVGCGEDTESPTSVTAPSETSPELATASTQALAFYQVSGGNDYTCGVTTDNRAFCWGYGLLGDGSTYSQRLNPVAVSGGLRFRQVSVGSKHSCGITTDNRAYCWGDNSAGQLGDGTRSERWSPIPVAGGRQFAQVDAGSFHTCGLGYTDKRAYCWGNNNNGQLGNGTVTSRLTPVAVAGGRQFRHVSAGWDHSCAVTPSDVAYCWGSNKDGQAGDGSTFRQRLRPVLVAGGYRFRQVDAGASHTCAVTTAYRAFCWGNGADGRIGDGTTSRRLVPRAVAGGLSFDRVSTGFAHSCGESRQNRAYCWGINTYGAVGDGTKLNTRLRPVAVAGGLYFTQLSAGSLHTCAKTETSAAYCWGYNRNGQLGDGSQTDRTRPVPVAGPM